MAKGGKTEKHEKPTTKPTDMGTNRTGIATSPVQAKAAREGAEEACGGAVAPEAEALTEARAEEARNAPPVGTMSPPASLKGAAKAVVQALKGASALAFIDLLGERLAFERTGTRLYDALLVKLEGADPRPGGPTREDLESIREDEMRHFVLVREAIEALGGDPTMITPSANVCGVAAAGWVQALTDPRTTLTEALKVVLSAELADYDGWETLTDVAAGLGQDELAEQFREAATEEEAHVARVRTWITRAVSAQAGIEAPVTLGDGGAARGAPAP